ncbi:MAG: uracil-DNA glycosylase [Bosea sp. (in: a-proteobacteria)]
MSATFSDALAAFLREPAHVSWRNIAPIANGRVARVLAAVDSEFAAGEHIAPAPDRVFAALQLTPLSAVRVVILGQDPYPTPGDANGLAFSYVGRGRLPKSLANIYRELADDLGQPMRQTGDLSVWASQGVLLLNTALTVREGAGKAGAHLKLGWQEVTDAIIALVSRQQPHVVFMLWGAPAQAKRALIDERQHLVIASPHPSPLSAYRGFFGSKPFSRANTWLAQQGLPAINW